MIEVLAPKKPNRRVTPLAGLSAEALEVPDRRSTPASVCTHDVLAAVLDVDGRLVGSSQIEVAGHAVTALRPQVWMACLDAVTRADDDVEPRVQPCLPSPAGRMPGRPSMSRAMSW